MPDNGVYGHLTMDIGKTTWAIKDMPDNDGHSTLDIGKTTRAMKDMPDNDGHLTLDTVSRTLYNQTTKC